MGVRDTIFFLVSVFLISGSSIVSSEKLQPQAIYQNVNLDYQATTGGGWCVANPSASAIALQVALDYACGYGGADCSGIQPGAGCYEPSTVKDHASFAFNSYYQKNPAPNSCVFGGTAQLVYADPSNGNCRYVSSSTTTTTTAQPPPSISPPVDPSPPTVMTPTSPTDYRDFPPYDSGEGPTGEPSSAISVSSGFLAYFIATGLYGILVHGPAYLCIF